jgi:disulfide bond formation protein DsbB
VRVYQFRHTGIALIYIFGRSSRQKEIRTCGSLPNKGGSGLASPFKIGKLPIVTVPPHGCNEEEMPMKGTWTERLRREPAAVAALAIFVLGAATLLGAWYFEYVVKLPPCPLCLEERLPYHIVVPLSLLMAIAALVRAPAKLIAVGFVAIIVTALCGAALGVYHAGVEWHWWAGPADCSGPVTDFTSKGSLLGQLQSIRVVRCDEAAWRFLGLSLAGYNVLISLALAGISVFGLFARKPTA